MDSYTQRGSQGSRGAAILGQVGRAVLAWGTAALALTEVVPAAANAQQPAAPAAALVFDGVTVIDVVQGKRISEQRVVVAGNRIVTVGSARSVAMPNGALVVEAKGKYLIPGLWDLEVYPSSFTDLFYPLLVANGVTGIRIPGSPVPLEALMLQRREILAGTRVGPPRQILSGASVDNLKTFYQSTPYDTIPCSSRETYKPLPGHICVSSSDSADMHHLVDSLKAAGADMLKMYDLSRQMYFAIARYARHQGIRFGGHLLEVTAIEASDSGASIVDHPMGGETVLSESMRGLCMLQERSASMERCQSAAKHFQRNGTWWVPTLSSYYTFDTDSPFFKYRCRYNRGVPSGCGTDSLGLLYLASRVGIPILAGTNVNPSYYVSLHSELGIEVGEGLTPLAALQSATLNPATMLHATDSLGTVAPGKLADLVLLDADPLANIANTRAIRAVVANGRYYDRAALDQLLAPLNTVEGGQVR